MVGRTGPGRMHFCGSVHGKGNFGDEFGRPIVTNGDFAKRHSPVPKLRRADLFLFWLVKFLRI